jgi:hypothetical protein
MSNMCSVPLSDVHASHRLPGLIARPVVTAVSTPRRNSPIWSRLAVSNALINVPFIDAVATIEPSSETAMARKAEA